MTESKAESVTETEASALAPMFTWAQVIEATGGKLISQAASQDLSFGAVSTDTRRPLKGQLFVALKGNQFDAHDFLTQALDQGATGIMVHLDQIALRQKVGEENWQKYSSRCAFIQVADTLRALQDLAYYWRKGSQFKVVAISGSNGKTTTKEYLGQLLEGDLRVHVSPASFNNHWGVPISLLQAKSNCEWVVQEMGMNHQGELTRLCEIAEPDVAVVTMVGQAHIGELGGQEQVAAAKEELYLASPQALHIFNLDNEWTSAMHARAKEKGSKALMTFSGFNASADVCLRAEQMSLAELEVSGHIAGVEGKARVPVCGRQNVVNLMAASAAALAVGMAPERIWAKLPQCQGSWGRSQLVRLAKGTQVLFDAYNANPESMKALLNNLYEMPVKGRRVAVLGEMFELGEAASRLHFELGQAAGLYGLDELWFMGPHWRDFEAGLRSSGFSKNAVLSEAYEQSLALKLGSVLNPEDVAIIKGSRAMKMERVLEDWQSLAS